MSAYRSALKNLLDIPDIVRDRDISPTYHFFGTKVALRLADTRRRARQLATENVVGQWKENKNDVARIERAAKKSHKG